MAKPSRDLFPKKDVLVVSVKKKRDNEGLENRGHAGYFKMRGGANQDSILFTKRLREGVRRGEITCSVRIWKRLHVKAGARYPMEEGQIEIDSITPIGLPDITPQLAQASGFLGVLDLLKVAQHGKGENIYLVHFHYLPPRKTRKK